jgi:hypothetical protein
MYHVMRLDLSAVAAKGDEFSRSNIDMDEGGVASEAAYLEISHLTESEDTGVEF